MKNENIKLLFINIFLSFISICTYLIFLINNITIVHYKPIFVVISSSLLLFILSGLKNCILNNLNKLKIPKNGKNIFKLWFKQTLIEFGVIIIFNIIIYTKII